MGYVNFPKPDVHLRDIFTALNLCQDKADDYQLFNPSSAVQEFGRWDINKLRLKSGHFLHYIFDDLRFVGEKDLHSLEQHFEFLLRVCHHPESEGLLPSRQQDIQRFEFP